MHLQPVRPLVITDAALNACKNCGARQHSVCSAIDDADLGRLASIATVRKVEKGRVFIEEGESAGAFYNVTGGTVKLFKLLPDGRQQIMGFAGVGHFLGLAVRDTYAFSAEAIEPVRVCRFSHAHLRGVLDDFPRLERKLLETACHELATAQEQMLLLGRKTARERVASFLLAWSARSNPCADAVERLHLPMTRGEIADYLGLTIETVSRTFSRFKSERRIDTPSIHDVIILDRAELQDMALGSA